MRMKTATNEPGSRRRAAPVSGAIATLLLLLPTPAPIAGGLSVVPDESIVAIVTHKAGFASGLAHDHLIAASDYEARLKFDPASPTSTRFEFRAKAEALLADDPDLQKKWYPRLETLEILSEPFAKVSDKNRAKIHGSMLGKKQLDAERFPEISGSISKVVDAEDPDFPYLVTITLDVHGQRVQREIRGRYEQTENGVDLEAVGEFRFTDFGIKPFSAFLGAVKNRDNLHLYVRLRAR